MWDYIQNDQFFPGHFVNNELMHKPINLWNIEDKEKMQQNFKEKIIYQIVYLCF